MHILSVEDEKAVKLLIIGDYTSQYESEVDNTIVHSESASEYGHGKKKKTGTMYLWSDSVFSPTVHKCDDTSAGISAEGVTEESPVLSCFELFLLCGMMNTVANKFFTYHKQDTTYSCFSSHSVEEYKSRGTCVFFAIPSS